MLDLPLDIVIIILEWCDTKSFCSIRKTCSSFNGEYLKNIVIKKKYHHCLTNLNNPWIWAAMYGHLDLMQWLFYSMIPTFNSQVSDVAVMNNQIHIVKFLIDNKSYTNRNWYYVHNYIIKNGYNGMIKFLIDNRIKEFNYSHVERAAKKGNLELVKIFYEANIPAVDTSALDSAIKYGHYNVIRFILENNYLKKTYSFRDGTYYSFWTMAKNGYLDCIKYLCENDYPGNPAIPNAIVYATKGNRYEIVEYLINFAKLRNIYIKTSICYAFNLAASFANEALFNYLSNYVDGESIGEKLDIYSSYPVHKNPIIKRAEKGELMWVEFLCENMTMTEEIFEAAINIAKQNFHIEVVEYLASAKIDILPPVKRFKRNFI